MATGIVPARKGEPARLRVLVEALIEGVGADAENVLSAYPERAIGGIASRIKEAQRTFVPKPDFRGDVKLEPSTKVREGRATVYDDRFGTFARGVGYTGFAKSLYEHDWFDSGSAERDLANLIDDAPEVAVWLRLQRGDLPLPWRGPNEAYHPDFVVVEVEGSHFVIEGKRDTDADREDVAQKREAAARWANHVTTATGDTWRYLFALESDIKSATTGRGAAEALHRDGAGPDSASDVGGGVVSAGALAGSSDARQRRREHRPDRDTPHGDRGTHPKQWPVAWSS
jgi:type III restriction enzyme